jgi:hypothetical protein
MKFIFSFFSWYLLFFGVLSARSEISEQHLIFRQIAMNLQPDIDSQISSMPNSFEKIDSIQSMIKRNPSALKFLNLLALVPSMPTIESHVGMSTGLKNYRLFALSRVPCFDPVLSKSGPAKIQGGRFLFLIHLKNNECFPTWVPEPEVQFILGQVGGFDPEKQPLAFQDLIPENGGRMPSENETRGNRNDTDRTLPTPDDSKAIAPVRSLPETVAHAAEPALIKNLIPWLAGLVAVLVMLLGYLGWRYFRKKARS